LQAAEKLQAQNIDIEVIYFHTLKPFDNEIVHQSVKKTQRLLTVEEISAYDGLHNLCLRSTVGLPLISIEQLAIDDFIQGYGSYDELCSRTNLNAEGIIKTAKIQMGLR
jgi:transketolase